MKTKKRRKKEKGEKEQKKKEKHEKKKKEEKVKKEKKRRVQIYSDESNDEEIKLKKEDTIIQGGYKKIVFRKVAL